MIRNWVRSAAGLGVALTSWALLLAPAPSQAGVVTNASVNGVADSDVQFVTASASVSTLGPPAVGNAATEAAFSSKSDLSQTAQLGVVVPDGYSLSSSSGVFLTVPEPRASAPLALSGVALLAVVRRRWLPPERAGAECRIS